MLLSAQLIRWYTVLYFLPKRSILLPSNDKITGLVSSQNGANIHWSVPTSLQDPAINLYMWVVDFLKFCCLVESPLYNTLKGGGELGDQDPQTSQIGEKTLCTQMLHVLILKETQHGSTVVIRIRKYSK